MTSTILLEGVDKRRLKTVPSRKTLRQIIWKESIFPAILFAMPQHEQASSSYTKSVTSFWWFLDQRHFEKALDQGTPIDYLTFTLLCLMSTELPISLLMKIDPDDGSSDLHSWNIKCLIIFNHKLTTTFHFLLLLLRQSEK